MTILAPREVELWVIQVDPDCDSILAGTYVVGITHDGAVVGCNPSSNAAKKFGSQAKAKAMIERMTQSGKMPPLIAERIA